MDIAKRYKFIQNSDRFSEYYKYVHKHFDRYQLIIRKHL